MDQTFSELEELREAATLLMLKATSWKHLPKEERVILHPVFEFFKFDPDPASGRHKMFYYTEAYAKWIEGWLRKMEETKQELIFRPLPGKSVNTIECKISQGILWLEDHGDCKEWLAALRPLIYVRQQYNEEGKAEAVKIKWKVKAFSVVDGELVRREIDTTPVDKADWKKLIMEFVDNSEEGMMLCLREDAEGRRYYFSSEAQEWIKEFLAGEVIRDTFYLAKLTDRLVKIANSRELVQMKKDGQI